MEEAKKVKHYTLSQVLGSVQKTIQKRYGSPFWILAEMNKLNYYSYSGHCYPELVEKKDGTVVAEMKGNLWSSDYQKVNKKFISAINEPLKDGIKILFLAELNFSVKYGLSLKIKDIDPNYTLGDLEKEKKETIARLTKAGIFQKNKSLSIPLLPKRIAIISVKTSKGYADFMKVLNQNSWGYNFFTLLFPSILQGNKAVTTIINQLKRISKVKEHFDVVVIIRGGGGDVGLSSFNKYELAKEITLFPLPILSGIGHATNQTVSEMVSNTSAITPTKIAEFLIQKFHNFSVPVQEAEKVIINKPIQIIEQQKQWLDSEIKTFKNSSSNLIKNNSSSLNIEVISLKTMVNRRIVFEGNQINQQNNTLKNNLSTLHANYNTQVNIYRSKLKDYSKSKFKEFHFKINELEKLVEIMKPENVLKRGYSIVKSKGNYIMNTNDVVEGDLVDIELYKGIICAKVENIKQKKDD